MTVIMCRVLMDADCLVPDIEDRKWNFGDIFKRENKSKGTVFWGEKATHYKELNNLIKINRVKFSAGKHECKRWRYFYFTFLINNWMKLLEENLLRMHLLLIKGFLDSQVEIGYNTKHGLKGKCNIWKCSDPIKSH